PELPLSDWLAALDAQMREVPGFFSDRPVVADLSAVVTESREHLAVLLDGLEMRNFRLVGVEGAEHALLDGTRWSRLATELHGRDISASRGEPLRAPEPPAPTPEPPNPPPNNSLLIDGPVRSGQSIVFPEGDVTIIGAVASGAEVIAGGSLHVYGALRG